MEITFLGTSSAIHTKNRNHPAIALKGFGEVILFDCGESTQKQMIFAKISPMKITKIFLTHYHGDHFLGLPGLIQSMNFRGRETKLDIYGPKPLLELKDHLFKIGPNSISFPINFHEVDNGKIVETEEYLIKCEKVKHNTLTFAYSIEEKKKPKFLRDTAVELGVPVGPLFKKLHEGEEIKIDGKTIKPEQVTGKPRKGKKITYSGDTTFCEEMIDFAKDSDLLIHESTYISEDEDKALEHGHSTSKQAAYVAKQSNSKKLILTHISPRYSDLTTMLIEAKKVFKNVEIAEDFMKINV